MKLAISLFALSLSVFPINAEESGSILKKKTVYKNFLRENPPYKKDSKSRCTLLPKASEASCSEEDSPQIPPPYTSPSCCTDLPSFFGYVSYHFGQSLIEEENYTSTGFYYISNLSQKRLGFYLEADGYFVQDGDTIQTTGIGVRFRDPCLDWIWGATLFGDTRFTDDTTLFQLGLSFQLYTTCFSAYLNGYFPTGHYSGLYTYSYDGPYSASAIGELYLMKGVDYLLGRYLPLSSGFALFGGLGGYHFSSGRAEAFNGFQIRCDIWYHSIAFMGFLLTTDRTYGSLVEGKVGITIPLDALFCYNSLCELFQGGCCFGCYTNGYNGNQGPLPRLARGGIVGCCCRYNTDGF